jgi:hypothetical protein
MKRAITDMTLTYYKLYNLYYIKNNNIFKDFEIIFINENKIEYEGYIYFKKNIIELWIKNEKGQYNFKELVINEYNWNYIKNNNIDNPIVIFWKKNSNNNSMNFIFKSLFDVNKFIKNI